MCRLQSADRFGKIIILINSRWWWWVNNTSLMRKKIHYLRLSSSHISRDASRVFKYREAHECKAVWVHLLVSKSQRDGVDHNLMLIAVLIYFSEPKRLRAQAVFGNTVLEGALNPSALSERYLLSDGTASCVVTALFGAVAKPKYRCVTSRVYNNCRCRM